MFFIVQLTLPYKVLSWRDSTNLLFRIQKRLFKVAYVLDKRKLLLLQKLILRSSFARLLAIREVTQLSLDRKVSGVDGKTSLTFLERFELNEYLKSNWNNWTVQSLKKVIIVRDKFVNKLVLLKIPTISDRAWMSLVQMALEPIHEAFFHPSNYGFRSGRLVYDVQNAFLLNLSKESFGPHKRILKVNFSSLFSIFDHNYLIKKIRAPRSIKLGIFRLLEKGFDLGFSDDNNKKLTFSSLISNILLDGIENIHYCVHYGYDLLIFLRPLDNEKIILDNLKVFVLNAGLRSENLSINVISVTKGFDFLGWHFTFSAGNLNRLYCVPSFSNYQIFLRRVKRIINNSNYGSLVKANKLYPIIKEWKTYHKFSDLISSRLSLFFIKKRAFKAFNSESKQDFYSSKRLIDKCFSAVVIEDDNSLNLDILNSPFSGHMTFCFDSPTKFFYNYFCIHCGMKAF
jgi:RNA-directed DNA polymerase